MKKILALLLMMAVLFSFSGCITLHTTVEDTKDEEDAEEKEETEEKDEEAEEKTDGTEDENEDEDEKSEEAAENDAETEEAEPAYVLEDFIGITEDDVYENRYMGIGFEVPDSNWSIADAETTAWIEDNAKELFDTDLFDKAGISNIMTANCMSGPYAGSSTNIQAEKLNYNTKHASIETFAESFEMLFDEMAESSEIPMTLANIETTTVKLAGKNYDALSYELHMDTLVLYAKVPLVKKSDYMFTITIMSPDKDYVDVIVDSYYAVK